MIQLGDIILIDNYLDVNGDNVSTHPMVVVNTIGGKICGLDFDLIGCFMSSFKSPNHRNRISKFKSNILVNVFDGVNKESYIKADVIYYFDSTKISFINVGKISEEVYEELIVVIELLAEQNKLRVNTNNLSNAIK